jgi:hypothetical protein
LGALAVIWAPVRTLARAAEERWVLLAFGIVALYAALNLVSTGFGTFSALDQLQSGTQVAELPPEFEGFFTYFFVLALMFSVVWPFISWLLISGLMQLVTRFFGGTGPFSGMLAVVGVAHVPYLIERLVQLPLAGLQILLVPDPAAVDPATGGGLATTILGLLSFLLWLAALVWFVILVVVGAAFARRVGYGESAGSCAISCAGVVGLILVVGVVLAVVVAAIVGAAGSAGPS